MSDPLESALTVEAIKRLQAGEFTVVALAGDGALNPIRDWLEGELQMADLEQIAVIVVRRDDTKVL